MDPFLGKQKFWKDYFGTFCSNEYRLQLYANSYDTENNGILQGNEIVGYDANRL